MVAPRTRGGMKVGYRASGPIRSRSASAPSRRPVRAIARVLRLSRPAYKRLSKALIGPAPAEKLGEGGSGEAVRRDRGEEGEHRQALAELTGGISSANRTCQRAAARSYFVGYRSARSRVSSSANR